MKRFLENNGDEEGEFPKGIEIGRTYKLNIEGNGLTYYSLQYGFKPSNIDTSNKAGILEVDSLSGDVKSFLFRKDEEHPIEFRGNIMQTLTESALVDKVPTNFPHFPSTSTQGENNFMLEYDDQNDVFSIKPFRISVLNLRQTAVDSSSSSCSVAAPSSGTDILKKFIQKAKQTQQKKARLQSKVNHEVAPIVPIVLESQNSSSTPNETGLHDS